MATLVQKCNRHNLQECIERIFLELNVDPRGLVFIKPNFSAREYTRESENSDPQFLHELASFLVNRKCQVVIGHRSNLGTKDMAFPFERIIKAARLDLNKKFKNVAVVDLDKESTFVRKVHEASFHVPEILQKADYYINLAKLKTHMQTGVTLSLKNQMGLLPANERKGMHKDSHLEKHIAYLGKAISPTISIVEGIVAMEGNGPHHGRDKRLNIVLAGDDMVELDSLATSIMGFDYKRIRHICVAASIGAGKLVDDGTVRLNRGFMAHLKPPTKHMRLGTSLYVWPTDACPGCLKALEEAGKQLKKNPLDALRFLKNCYTSRQDIVLGNCEGLDAGAMKPVAGFGRCAKQYCISNNIRHLDGCPLASEDIRRFLKELFK